MEHYPSNMTPEQNSNREKPAYLESISTGISEILQTESGEKRRRGPLSALKKWMAISMVSLSAFLETESHKAEAADNFSINIIKSVSGSKLGREMGHSLHMQVFEPSAQHFLFHVTQAHYRNGIEQREPNLAKKIIESQHLIDHALTELST